MWELAPDSVHQRHVASYGESVAHPIMGRDYGANHAQPKTRFQKAAGSHRLTVYTWVRGVWRHAESSQC
jgi:hypothetical protein